jgi:hypothetical protein
MLLSPWGRVVAISALLVVGGAVALAFGAIASAREYRRAYPVLGAVESLRFDLADGDIVVVGGGQRDSVQVDRTERYAFGHGPATTRKAVGAAFSVHSRCPTLLLGACTVAYRVVVPDNVGLDIHTTTGSVNLRGYRGSARVVTDAGGIDISGYCGNALDARAGAGAINLQAACAPPRMSLRTGSGEISAVMPAGRYDLDAESSSGRAIVRGVTARPDAPYVVQVLSGSGDISVEGRS